MQTYSDFVNTIHLGAIFTLRLSDLRELAATTRLDILFRVQAIPRHLPTRGK